MIISPRHVVTCAHVLQPSGGDRPKGKFLVDVPRIVAGRSMTARVAGDGWFPPDGDFRGDIAVLELDHPLDLDVQIAALGRADQSRGRDVQILGHPRGLPEGNWFTTKIVESVGAERVQLDNSPGGIAQGFSGGGVLDLKSGLVVGIVSSVFRSDRREAAYMIPMEIVAGYWPRLNAWLGVAAATEPQVSQEVRRQIADRLMERRMSLDPAGLAWVAAGVTDAVRGRLRTGAPSMIDLIEACEVVAELRLLVDLVFYRSGSTAGRGPIDDLLATAAGDAPDSVDPTWPADEPLDIGLSAQAELYGLLTRQQHFLDRKTREVYLDALVNRVRQRRGLTVNVTVTDSATDDAAKLVAECCRVPGMVRLLADDFPFGDRDRNEFLDLLLFVEMLSPRRWLTDEERDSLLVHLREVSPDVLAIAHREIAPVGEPAVFDSVPVLVRRIEKYNQQPDEAPRLFAFVEHVAARLAALRGPLRLWSDLVAARLRQPKQDIDNLRMSIVLSAPAIGASSSVSEAMPVMTVQLAPDAQMPDNRFLLTVTLEGGAAVGGRVLARPDASARLESIRPRLDELGVAAAAELGARLDDLTIEFVLPRSLITEPVDRWVIASLASEPVGVRFRVYSRSYERVHRKKYWEQWNRRWDLVRRPGAPSVASAHYVEPDEQSTPERTDDALHPEKLVWICGRPPARQARLRPADSYRAALEAGVPCVVWVRDPGRADELRMAVEQHLAEAPVIDLPDRVTEWRSDDWFDSEAAGWRSQVSLVFCDHDRKMPLTSRGVRAPGRMPS